MVAQTAQKRKEPMCMAGLLGMNRHDGNDFSFEPKVKQREGKSR